MRANNVLVAGLSMFRDRSEDARTTTTTTTMIGRWRWVRSVQRRQMFPTPVVLGPVCRPPVRVPNSTFR
jgi:hypothetical protein